MSTRLIYPAAAALALSFCGAGPKGEGGPRAIIRRAIRAAGGEEALMRPPAVYRRLKMSFPPPPAEKGVKVEVAPLDSAEEFIQAGGGAMKSVLVTDLSERRSTFVAVSDGERSWRSADGKVQSLSAEELEAMRDSAHLRRALRLVPLLTDRDFALADLGEATVDGRPARCVKVSYKGKLPLRFYFDVHSGLLVKFAHRVKSKLPVWGKKPGEEVLYEVTLRDHRVPDLGAADERVLKAAGVATEGPSLLAFLRRQGAGPAAQARVAGLVKKLGDDSFGVREKAEAELVTLGAVALPALREAAEDDDLEVLRRARRCILRIGQRQGEKVVCAAVRLATVRHPPGAVEALLDCLPGAAAPVADEVRAALSALAHEGGKPHPALVRALADTDPVKRAAARAVLGKDGGAYLKRPGRRLYLRGPRVPMKETFAVDGKVMSEREVLEQWCFNCFDAKEFARPGPGPAGGRPGRAKGP